MMAIVQQKILRMSLGLGVMALICLASTSAYAGPTRIEFDERLIQGQTKKANSIYIFKREQSEVRSLVSRKRSFKKRIILTVFND